MENVALVYVGSPEGLKELLKKPIFDNAKHLILFVLSNSSLSEVIEASRDFILEKIGTGSRLMKFSEEDEEPLLREIRVARESGLIDKVYFYGPPTLLNTIKEEVEEVEPLAL